MNYAELKKAYDLVIQKCSSLEKEVNELKKSNEDKDLRIEHLTELVVKRNKMLFGQKSEKSKFIKLLLLSLQLKQLYRNQRKQDNTAAEKR